ncbi:MAG: tRNA (uridine(34)/cytosine(34)/5-carboxymethylaminomethyluridine(34)-2'-O)-methyltransferase TrmL [Proteobacteria bacterium]|nr:tRNA (uridine(34)/cytosine(34)/5-carboxymethylaminomethyluridine(34)-2'-O)-methyltransferase TrmL [Pseudomonadota bacterium]
MSINVVLYQPEIPPNTGNIIRLCANTGANLHLVKPLGFDLDDARLRRAGLDYHEFARVQVHERIQQVIDAHPTSPVYALTTKGSRAYTDVQYGSDDILLFGPETRGLPQDMLDGFDPAQCLRIPMLRDSRSLNLSNAVAVVVYEAARQLNTLG